MQRLNDFISSVRMAETIDQEKYIIATELAKIRASIKVCEAHQRPVIVSKLMFLDLLGYNVQWGNTETINLMSDDSFSYKRIGYFGAAQLLDSDDDMNVLATQTLLKDLASKNPYVQSLALGFIANCGSAEVCASVAVEVQKLMQHTPAFVLKRAGMAALTIVRKNPELCESFKNSVQSLLNNSSHGIVISGLNLVIEMLRISPKLSRAWSQFAIPLTKILKNLITGRVKPEYATENYCDPFMQMKTLRALSLLRKKSEETEFVLTTIIDKAELTSNVGRSIIYEVAETAVSVSKSQSIRGLAFNSIGRLLSLNDPNTLYSALCAFDRVLSRPLKGDTDMMAIQRYKSKITKCLGNEDPSIRRRALSVISALIDEKNAETLIPEILEYVKLSDADFRADIVSKVYVSALKYKKNDKWFLKTVLDLLRNSGEYIGSELLSSFCEFVGKTSERAYAVEMLSRCLLDPNSAQPLIQAAAFIVGEYGVNVAALRDMGVLIYLPQMKLETKLYLLSGSAKLAARLGTIGEIVPLLEKMQTSNDAELQQRSGELLRMFQKGIAQTILTSTGEEGEEKIISVVTGQKEKDDDDDLLGLLLDSPQQNQSSQTAQQQTNDLLSMLSSQAVQKQTSEFVYICDDFRVKFDRKTNEQDPRQHALRLLFFFTKPIRQFRNEFVLSPGWRINVKPNPPTDFNEGQQTQEVIYVMDDEQKPFDLKVRSTFIGGGQQVKEYSINRL
jgi:AP-1 complex subunit gamma-1